MPNFYYEIKDKFHTFEGELFQLFASNMRENCNGHGLKILKTNLHWRNSI